MIGMTTVLLFMMGPILMIGLSLSVVFIVEAWTCSRNPIHWGEPGNVLTDYRFLLAVGVTTLVASWSCILYTVWGLSGWMLIPWEMWGNLRPPLGTWDREVNDFFNTGDNQFLPALVVLGVDITIFAVRFSRANDRALRSWLPLAFVLINLVFLLACILEIFLLHGIADLWLPQPRPQLDFGYHRTWPSMVFYLLLAGGLFWGHSRISVPEFWRRQCLDDKPSALLGDS